jgi:hypothetical protein
MTISDNMSVEAKHFIEKGVTLHSHLSHREHDWAVSPSQGPLYVDVSISGAKQSMAATTVVPHVLQVGNKLTVNADNWDIHDSDITVNQLAGAVDHLTLSTTPESIQTSMTSYHAATTGDIGFAHSREANDSISTETTLHIQDGHSSNQAFLAGDIKLIDSQVIAETGFTMGAKTTVINQPLQHLSHSRGLSTNIFHPMPPVIPDQPLANAALVETAAAFSQSVYGDDRTPLYINHLEYVVTKSFRDDTTGSYVNFYENADTGQVFVAFRGTADLNSVMTDDLDIAFSKALQSENSALWQATRSAIEEYRESGYDITLTGHSRGAVQASLLSEETGLNAIVFDNPGIIDSKKQRDFSNVTSIQSTANIINQLGLVNGRSYNQGKIVALPNSLSDNLLEVGAKVVEERVGVPLPKLAFGAFQTWWSHSMNHIDKKVTLTTDNQPLSMHF